MTKGFFFDQTACSGCRSCQIACKDRNDLAMGELFRTVTTYQVGRYPEATMYHFSASCNHCQNPACTAACPTGAMGVADDGTVQHDDELCVGCQACVAACPYQVPVYLEARGVVGKCDACKPFTDAGKNPVCVDACTMRCLEFGDLDELRAAHGADLVRELPVHPDGGTDPCTLVRAKDAALREGFSAVIL